MVLEMIGDLLEQVVKPPEFVLFVCKHQPLIKDEDLDALLGWFGKVKSTHIIRDFIIGNNLRYAFIGFETKKLCEDARENGHTIKINDREYMWISMKASHIYGNNIGGDRDLEAT